MATDGAVLVTGCSSGFGLLTAQALARRGHTVYACVRDANDGQSDELERLAADGLPLHVLEMDVTDDGAVEDAVARAAKEADLAAVVNNAGVGTVGVLEAYTVEQVRRIFDVNVLGAVRVNRAALPHLRARGRGLLVHVSSVGGRLVFPFAAVYSATKFALEALADGYHIELAPLGIESVVVEPGPYRTRFVSNVVGPEDEERAQAYGPVAEAVATTEQALRSRDERADGPDPAEVADTVVGLVEAEPGTRPRRTLVGGQAAAIQGLNDTIEQYQERVLAAFRGER